MMSFKNRREFLQRSGIGLAAANFAWCLPSLGFANTNAAPKKTIVFVFSPNGVITRSFLANASGSCNRVEADPSPLEPFRDKTLTLQGLGNRINATVMVTCGASDAC